MPTHNPFIFDAPVTGPHFIGREREIGLILDRIGNHSRGSIALAGERRMGKTSLLRHVSSPEVKRRFGLAVDKTVCVCVYLDCASIPRFSLPQFWQTVLRQLVRQLKRMADTEDLCTAITRLANAAEINTQDIEFLLDDLHDAGWAWVLLLDEFEWLVRTDAENEVVTRDLLGGLRALTNHVPRVLSLVVTTRQPLHELCGELRFMGSPFYNHFVYLALRPFQVEEAERLLAQGLAGTGLDFSPQEQGFLFELAGRHPLLLQAAAYGLFEAKTRGTVDLAQVRVRFAEMVRHQFEDLWLWSKPREKLLLLALALGAAEASGWLSRFAHERESLQMRGLVDEKRRLFSAVFSQWLLDNDYRLVDEAFKRWAKDNGFGTWLVEYAYLPSETTAPVQPTTAAKPRIFISYSRQDSKYKEALAQHLRVLQSAELVEQVWEDGLIEAGADWRAEIERAMAGAQIALFLVSAAALTSDFIFSVEIPALLKRRETEGMRLLPVIARPCAWKTVEWLLG